MASKSKLLIVTSVIYLFGVVGFCGATTIFKDDFNSYNNGSINGQGGWVSSGFQVQDNVVNEGVKAISAEGRSKQAIKEGNSLNDGTITFYVRKDSTGSSNSGDFELWQSPTNQTGGILSVRITILSGNNKIFYFSSLGKNVSFGTINSDTWHSVQVQWRSVDHKIRYRLNGGTWTDWVEPFNGRAWTTGLGGVRITSAVGINSGFPTGKIYFDAIQESPINETKTPVLIIPGILGSAQKDGVWVIDPILHTYDNLIDAFEANGYIEGETLFPFPYDWHQSNVDTALELKEKIDQVKEICDCQKVDVVGHSMGGLITRQYIQSDDYQDDIDKVVFLGTPHLGVPEDYLAWEGGVVTPKNDIIGKAFERIYRNEARQNGYNDTFSYIRNKPISSVQELLPIYNYLVDSNPLAVRHYPDNYPTNSFLENLNDSIATLNSSNVEIYNIIGDSQNNSTINFIRVVPSDKLPLWEHGYPEGFDENTDDRGLSLGAGDGTVPSTSSDIFSDAITINSDHIGLPTNSQAETFDALLGDGDHTTVDDFHLPNFKILIIKLLSPVDMQVIAPDGKIIGKDFNTNEEINEIPFAFYSGFQTDDEYITIINPEDGRYEVVTQGTNNGGEYTISSAVISDDQVLEHDFTAHIATNQIENINLDLSLANGTINVVPEDAIPPQITINSPQNQDYLHSDVLGIDYSATDEGSGIFSSLAKFDTIEVDNGQEIDLFYQNLGNHNFTIQAQDNVNIKQSYLFNFV